MPAPAGNLGGLANTQAAADGIARANDMANAKASAPPAADAIPNDWAQSAQSYGGVVPQDRNSLPPEFFVNPPLGGSPNTSPSVSTRQYRFPGVPKLFRGWIMESPRKTALANTWDPPSDYSRLYRMNFHFNPDHVTMDWSVTTPDFQPQSQQPDGAQDIAVYSTTGVQFGINLFLDREGDNHPLVKKWGGVNADIRILNAIMTSGKQPGDQTYATPAPVYCVIGRTYESGHTTVPEAQSNRIFGGSPKQYPLAITGFMSSMSVDYQRFDSQMTPTRAVVSLTIQVLTWSPTIPAAPALGANQSSAGRNQLFGTGEAPGGGGVSFQQ